MRGWWAGSGVKASEKAIIPLPLPFQSLAWLGCNKNNITRPRPSTTASLQDISHAEPYIHLQQDLLDSRQPFRLLLTSKP